MFHANENTHYTLHLMICYFKDLILIHVKLINVQFLFYWKDI